MQKAAALAYRQEHDAVGEVQRSGAKAHVVLALLQPRHQAQEHLQTRQCHSYRTTQCSSFSSVPEGLHPSICCSATE